MSIENNYRYTVQFDRSDGGTTDQVPLELDQLAFEAPVRDAHFQSMRQKQSPLETSPPPARVNPVWSEEGPPFVSGFEVSLEGSSFIRTYGRHLIAGIVARTTEPLIAIGQLQQGALTHYRIMAYRQSAQAQQFAGFELTSDRRPIETCNIDLSTLRLTRSSADKSAPGDMKVVIDESVISKVQKLARQSRTIEVGGALVGHLAWNREDDDLCLLVGGQIDVRGNATRTSFEFTPQNFSEIDRILCLRGRDEEIIGWNHFHPEFCVNCPAADRARCPLSTMLFSIADEDVHRTLFPNAWSVALLMSFFEAGREELSLFGWRDGEIQQRDFLTGVII